MQTLQQPPPPVQKKAPPRRDLRKLLSTRGGTALVAGVSALLAAALLMVFLNRYRDSVSGGDEAVTVLVAKTLIEKGSPGDVIAEDSIFQTTTMKKDDLKDGAISDPSNLKGKIATQDVYPGEQLVAGEFAPATPAIVNRLRGYDRAISVPLDESHGMIGEVRSGDHVDVLAGMGVSTTRGPNDRPTLRVLMHDALVLKAPAKSKTVPTAGNGNSGQPVVLRVPDHRAAQIAFASDNGKVWLVQRPKLGAKQSKTSVVDLQSLALRVVSKELSRLDDRSGGR
jgi:pilus assembly protein CpaB